jgi:hypothetical protein
MPSVSHVSRAARSRGSSSSGTSGVSGIFLFWMNFSEKFTVISKLLKTIF